ncbi:MAG: hypothetical protein KAS32_16375 [Candidatus Peribacteraceae bacterium]|nr:hypothetical protein [Candidatus Peribacteraceae bacterium]
MMTKQILIAISIIFLCSCEISLQGMTEKEIERLETIEETVNHTFKEVFIQDEHEQVDAGSHLESWDVIDEYFTVSDSKTENEIIISSKEIVIDDGEMKTFIGPRGIRFKGGPGRAWIQEVYFIKSAFNLSTVDWKSEIPGFWTAEINISLGVGDENDIAGVTAVWAIGDDDLFSPASVRTGSIYDKIVIKQITVQTGSIVQPPNVNVDLIVEHSY